MLHELIRYAQREGLSSEPGFKPKWVRWLLVFAEDGRFLSLFDLKGEDKKAKGREFQRCPDLSQGELIAAKTRHFLVDSVDKIVLFLDGAPNKKQIEQHSSYVGLLKAAGDTVPLLRIIANSLDNETILADIKKALTDVAAKPTDAATIAMMNGALPTIFVANSDWHDWWRVYRSELGSSEVSGNLRPTGKAMRCFLSGELVEPAATQNKVSGLSDVGGLPTGEVISSFDKDAFGHFGLSKGENAAISVQMVKEVTDALSHLIQRRSHRLCQAKVIYWYDTPVPPEDDPLVDVFGDVRNSDTLRDVTAMERADAESSAKKLLQSIRSGNKADLANCNYFALTLSGNSGRVIVRDWMQGRFEALAVNIGKWFDDLSIISRDGSQTVRKHKFESLLNAVVRDLKDVPSPMVSSLWQCAISGRPIPATVAAQALARAKIDLIKDEKDQAKLHARMGLLRAFLLRNSNSGVSVMSESVDDAINSPAYLCGRIMSLLASIQEKALGTVGAGVVQRYYAAASATPALVLGRLVRTAQIAHLPKIDGGLRHHFESQLADLWTRMQTSPPTTLSLEEQTLFAMGFYQQQASRFKKSELKNPASTDVSE